MTMADDDFAGFEVSLDDPSLPFKIREHAISMWQPGWSLWQVPTIVRRGLIFKREEPSTEWWLLDEHGDMVDAFWIDD